ncbi:hypothetical protein DFH28DRAFT_1080795 [Melampsora americana]|nr:hypothetical protein DFH28DRAFT_1080795 [Melampsora americana]
MSLWRLIANDCDTPAPEIHEKSTMKCNEVSKTKTEINTTMMDGEDVGHTMTSLSEYFHKLMINKTIHVPVSIFCPKWLLYDTCYMRSKQAKPTSCTSDTMTYNGHVVTNKYRLSFAEWTVRYDLMVKYQAMKSDILDSQKNSPIAPRLMAHKENVLQLKIECDGKWTPAMQYDVAHRRNVWENRLANGAMADNYGDYNYLDNPFVLGGPMQNTNPLDGLHNPSWDSLGTSVDNHLEMLTGRGMGVWGSQQVNAFQRESVVCASATRPRGNYKGQHFNPYHNKTYHTNQPRHVYHDNLFHQTGPGFSYSIQRGSFGGSNRGQGRGSRPAIGQGSFDKVTMGAHKPVAGGSGAASDTSSHA